jgi:hypothetical protein
MAIFLYSKSGKQYELIPQIRLTRSKNGTTGTALIEVSIEEFSLLSNPFDPIHGIVLKKEKSLRIADICQFVWAFGRPIKFIGIFIFSTINEKQDFFNYYPYYALNNRLEFFPAQMQEKTLNN